MNIISSPQIKLFSHSYKNNHILIFIQNKTNYRGRMSSIASASNKFPLDPDFSTNEKRGEIGKTQIPPLHTKQYPGLSVTPMLSS